MSAGSGVKNPDSYVISFTDLRRGGNVKGARDILSLELISRGLSRRWTIGCAAMSDVGSTSGARIHLPSLRSDGAAVDDVGWAAAVPELSWTHVTDGRH